MLEGIEIILHLLISTGLKSSADEQHVGHLTQFSTPIYPDFCQCIVQGTGAAWSTARGTTPHHKISSWLGGGFPSGKLKYLEFTKSAWKKSCCISRSCTQGELQWEKLALLEFPYATTTFPLAPAKENCCSVLTTSSEPDVYPQKFYLPDIFVEWEQKRLSSNALLICSSITLLHHHKPRGHQKDPPSSPWAQNNG